MSGLVRRLGPALSTSVAGWGRRERRSASMPLAERVQYSRVYVYAESNSSQRWARALWSPTLAIFLGALWSE